jgi:hypothetical protein
LNNLLNFILLGEGITIRENIWRKTAQNKRNGMIMDTSRRGKSLGGLKHSLVLGEDRLDVGMISRN